jgi:hypothetical protein
MGENWDKYIDRKLKNFLFGTKQPSQLQMRRISTFIFQQLKVNNLCNDL